MTQSKYKNKRTAIDGINFASKKEARRYQELKLLKACGKVKSFEIQKAFPLNDYARTKGEQVKIYM